MEDIPLINTNPYLKDPTQREKMFVTAVLTSTSIEGVHVIISASDKKFSKNNPPKTSKKPS